ncbi:hypothetical protein RGUI_2699 [Rhodovulum sp. P5]|uniref:hypothetical protein n=1 Tax=Rhodovulum sp. P5 TaxID=1564506 RepID=UPI0009C287E9|nr:hypothetical protein [Rhodovulum sp. P5]ARE40840.1 hypothetical protein RGUI_2699 [Rhodovulum sp. P5]
MNTVTGLLGLLVTGAPEAQAPLPAGGTVPDRSACLDDIPSDDLARADAFKAALMALDTDDGPDFSAQEWARATATAKPFSLDDLFDRDTRWPALVDTYDEQEDALFIVYDSKTHPDPVLSKRPSQTGTTDAMLMLDGMPLAVVSGGAGMNLAKVNLVPDTLFPEYLSAAV